jgi:hypothetical protein
MYSSRRVQGTGMVHNARRRPDIGCTALVLGHALGRQRDDTRAHSRVGLLECAAVCGMAHDSPTFPTLNLYYLTRHAHRR